MSDYVTVDHHVKKKKRTTGDASVDVSYSEHTELEGSGTKKKKKKNKHRCKDDETIMEVGSSDNISPSYSHNSFVKFVKQIDSLEQETSTWDCNSNTQKSHKKRKKKKEIEVSVEETDNTGQPNLYDGHFDEVSVTEEAPSSKSIRKKKKRHTPTETRSLEEDSLEDIQPSPLTTLNDNIKLEDSVRKKKYRPSEIRSLEEDALEDVQPSLPSKLNDNIDSENSVRGMKKRLSEILNEDNLGDETVTEDMSLNGETNLKRSERKKKEKSHETKVYRKTVHSRHFKIVKENSPKQSNKDHAIAEENEETENNFASEREAFKSITEATNSKTKDIVGTPAKNKKSALGMKSGRDGKQDVTAELEEPDQEEMENTLDQETIDLQEVNWLKQNRESMSGIEVLGSLPKRDVALLEEYFPKIRSLSGKSITNLVKNELHRIEDAKAKGIKFLTGRFESNEDELIKKNVEEFLTIVGLESGELLFHSYRFPDQKHTVEQLKKKVNFRHRIAKGLARTVVEVHSRGAKLYDLSGNKGRFTKEEEEKLKKLLEVHGNQWTTVAPLVGRCSASVQSKASQIKLEVTGGKWNIDEVNRLIMAVKKFIMRSLKRKKMLKQKPYTVPKEMLFTGIPWRQIAEKVQTRNWTHCKSKWNDILLLRMNNGFSPCEGVLGLQTNIEIIKWLYKAKPQKAQVNWVEMAKTIGNVPMGILQQKVYKLKSRHVPDWQKLSFKDIVTYMYTEILPVFEDKLNEPSSKGAKDIPEKKDEFLISDIFREYEGNEKMSLSKPFCIAN